LRFAGQYYDQETGLHYNYHRYYDPSLGRYLRADPIGLAGGVNLYAYVLNNPVNWIDPFGLWFVGVGGGGGDGSIIHPTGDSIYVGVNASRYLGTSRNGGLNKGVARSWDRTTKSKFPWIRSREDGSFWGAAAGYGFFVFVAPLSDVEDLNSPSEIYGIDILGYSIEINTSGFLSIGMNRGRGAALYHLHSNTATITTYQEPCNK
jgi:RHS repeat-associated protein